jgi:hypothetical protein
MEQTNKGMLIRIACFSNFKVIRYNQIPSFVFCLCVQSWAVMMNGVAIIPKVYMTILSFGM